MKAAAQDSSARGISHDRPAMVALEPLSLDGRGVGERVRQLRPLSRRAARGDLSRQGRGEKKAVPTIGFLQALPDARVQSKPS
jgi:hypothetical protein